MPLPFLQLLVAATMATSVSFYLLPPTQPSLQPPSPNPHTRANTLPSLLAPMPPPQVPSSANTPKTHDNGETLQHSRQVVVDKRVQLANTHRLRHEFQLQDQVLRKSVLSHSNKLVPSFTGPFEVVQVHMNGTCTIRLSPNQTEHINICRLKLYKS